MLRHQASWLGLNRAGRAGQSVGFGAQVSRVMEAGCSAWLTSIKAIATDQAKLLRCWTHWLHVVGVEYTSHLSRHAFEFVADIVYDAPDQVSQFISLLRHFYATPYGACLCCALILLDGSFVSLCGRCPLAPEM